MRLTKNTNFESCTKKKLLIVMTPVSQDKKEGLKKTKKLSLPSDLSPQVRAELEAFAVRTAFTAAHLAYETVFINKGQQDLLVALLGWDSSSDETAGRYETRARLGHAVYSLCQKYKVKDASLCVTAGVFQDAHDSRPFIEGIKLSAYSFDRYKKKEEQLFHVSQIGVLGAESEEVFLSNKDVEKISAVVDGALVARDLVNTTANDCNPETMLEHGRALAKKTGLSCKIYDKAGLKKLGAEAILAVGQGSDKGSYLLKLVHKPKKATKVPVIALIGKGVTFDSGGLSIKTQMMELMKFDMGGAAAVFGAMQAIAELNLPVEVRAYIPLVENMINGSSTKPGDVVKSLSGKTIEIMNTDAEGRLIMADALALAEKEGADVLVDIATLTGAVIVALGPSYAGLFTSDDEIARKFLDIAESTDEKLWRMPLPSRYKKLLQSKIADVKNIGGRWGGCITAALFLQEFVETRSWAHLDIAGVVWEESGDAYLPFGATGFGVRTLVRFVESYLN
jgi:leucyl aminopeptidase